MASKEMVTLGQFCGGDAWIRGKWRWVNKVIVLAPYYVDGR